MPPPTCPTTPSSTTWWSTTTSSRRSRTCGASSTARARTSAPGGRSSSRCSPSCSPLPDGARHAHRMLHEDTLIATLAMCLAFAFVFGTLAVRARLPPLAGYLLAGIALSPYTPGWVADPQLAPQLAEIGVILLMFGVGTHFSLADLAAVHRVAVPGALAQIAVATVLGALVAHFWGWPLGAGVIFGLALSVASTVVLL